jgi:tRNA-dihydrouridine synthase
VNARSLLEKNLKALKLIESCPADRPSRFNSSAPFPKEMRDATAYLESIGISSVDINMGCPVRKVCTRRGGSAMMTEIEKTSALVRGMVNAVKIPVSAKMRLGWDERKPYRARSRARPGRCGRPPRFSFMAATREQGFGGTVNPLNGLVDSVAVVRYLV